MPELPEVETIVNDIKPHMLNKEICLASVHREKLRQPLPKDLASNLTKRTITDVQRRAKYILVSLDNRRTLILHLGMAGRLLFFAETPEMQKHDHLRLRLNDQSWIIFRDPRCFGLVDLINTDDLDQCSYLQGLGPEPFSPDFNAAYLREKIRGKKISLKIFLLDQAVVAGIGNIYASEILYRMAIRPERSVANLSAQELAKIVPTTRRVLRLAIQASGTSLRDYVKADGTEGDFQSLLQVYGREKQPCRRCGTPIIRIKQGGRSTYYCPKCQK